MPDALPDKIAERRTVRAQISEKREAEANLLKKQGNDRFVKGDWVAVVSLYAQIANIHGPKPMLMSDMAAAYLKLGLFEEAEWAAMTALGYDPTSARS